MSYRVARGTAFPAFCAGFALVASLSCSGVGIPAGAPYAARVREVAARAAGIGSSGFSFGDLSMDSRARTIAGIVFFLAVGIGLFALARRGARKESDARALPKPSDDDSVIAKPEPDSVQAFALASSGEYSLACAALARAALEAAVPDAALRPYLTNREALRMARGELSPDLSLIFRLAEAAEFGGEEMGEREWMACERAWKRVMGDTP